MKIIAGNFKSNLTRKETHEFLKNLQSKIKENNKKIYIFPATSSLLENDFAPLIIGAQNCHFAQNGAFTGEISLSHLDEFRIQTLLIGHSERRQIFREDDEFIAQKFEFFKSKNFEIFFCIGENLETRKSARTKDFLLKQLESIDLNYKNLIIAYEPIWAIGTGENASLKQILEVYEFLKTRTSAPVIYGGSVNASNASEIIGATDGVLVGGASLKVDSFYQIIRSYQ